jgi:hypothetical protein
MLAPNEKARKTNKPDAARTKPTDLSEGFYGNKQKATDSRIVSHP